MNIQPISSFNTNFAFKSVRTDKNAVAQLKKGERPIVENKRLNILGALNNLSAQHDRGGIEFLLDVADNLTYGQGANSEFKAALDADGITPGERENTNWTEILADTVKKSLEGAEGDVSDLQKEYDRVFNQTKPLTEGQKKILDLRKSVTDTICNPDMLTGDDDLEHVTNIRKNLDYFVASSEVSEKEKEACLEKFVYLLSDDYKIDEQLKDKKLQVLDEVLNDITVKAPDEEVLRTKAIDQRATGMCASISICRKMMAYEDKARYTDLILEELKASNVMPVYDITELGSDKKVEIPKCPVDYDTAIAKGYRITDTAAHIWMNAAHASGDGTIQTETYIPFDASTYGIFDDASWYNGLQDQSKKFLLMSLIKENENIGSAMRTKKFISESSEQIRNVRREAVEGQSEAYFQLTGILGGIFTEKSDKEIRTLSDSVIKFYNGKTDGSQINVPGKFPSEIKDKIVSEFIEKSVDGITDEQKTAVKEKAGAIRQMTEEYSGFDKKIKSLKKFNTPAGRFSYNKRLFNAAAAHRLALETDLDLDDGVVRFERKSGLPPRNTQILNYLTGLQTGADSEKVRSRFANKKGVVPTKEKFTKDLNKDILAIDTQIPAQINTIIKKLTGDDFTTVMANMFMALSDEIKNGNEPVFNSVAETMNLKKDKTIVVKHLDKMSSKLLENPTKRDKNEAVRMLGYEDEVQLATAVMSSFYAGLQNGVSKEDFEQLAENFGGADNLEHGLTVERTKFNTTVKNYSKILNKWQVPGARDLIMKKLEQDNFVLSSDNLDALYGKFNDIQAQTLKNEKITNPDERRKENQKAYTFNQNETELFDKIEKALPSMRKYAKTTYQAVNKELQPMLEEQYSNLGMLNGQFWVREEGSSGLAGNEQIRIIEQMTGKPYHLESDAAKAAKEIKKGDGSGILSMSVDDADYGFHAQYVPVVTSERLTNPLTSEETIKDILWTDNSWGVAEKDNYWDGKDGFIHTDYGQGLGWKNGFMVSPDLKIGLPVDEINGAVGYCQRDDEEFGLFSNVVLPGTPVDTYQKLYKMFNYIFTMGADEQLYGELEKAISQDKENIDVKRLSGLDEIVSIRTKSLYDRLDKTIKTKEDFDKLPEDDELKFTFNKLALYFSTIDLESREEVLSACTPADLAKVKDEITETQLTMFGSIISKTDATVQNVVNFTQDDIAKAIDEIGQKYGEEHDDKEITDYLNRIFVDKDRLTTVEGSLTALEKYFNDGVDLVTKDIFKNEDAQKEFNEATKKIISDCVDKDIRIKSLDAPIIVNSPFKEQFLAAIDRVYEPNSDEEMLEIIQELQESTFDEANEFCEVLTDEELGIDLRPAYDYVVKYKTGDSAIMRALGDVIATNVLDGEIAKSDDENKSTPEELYRSLYIKLSELDVQKVIKSFKAEAFQKYKVREAFPEPVVIADDIIAKTGNDIADVIIDFSDNIANNNAMGDILDAHQQFVRKFKGTKLLEDIKSGKEEIPVNGKNKAQVEEMTAQAVNLFEKIQYNEKFQEQAEILDVMITELQNGTGNIAGTVLKECLSSLNEFAEDLKATGLTKGMIKETNKGLRQNIKNSTVMTVRANIDPKYQDEAINKMYQIVEANRKYYAPEEIDYLKQEFVDFFTEKHIVKNPPALLNECIKMVQNGETNTDAYRALKSYLGSALTVAQQTKVQYKLVQNEHAGISSKTKEMLPMFGVTTKDGRQESLDSEVGMLYLVNQLNNSGNNNQTLNLFLNQTGLSKRALSAVVGNYDFSKLKEIVDKEADVALITMAQIEELASGIQDFLAQSQIQYKSVEDCANKVSEFIERKYGRDKGEVFADYLDYMHSVTYTKDSYNFAPDTVLPYFDMLKTQALQDIIDTRLNSKFQVLSGIDESASQKVELAYAINVPENSKEAKEREAFEQQYLDLNKHISGKLQEIQEAVSQSKLLHT